MMSIPSIKPAFQSGHSQSAALRTAASPTPEDQIYFRGASQIQVLDYATLFPSLTAEEAKAYEQAEREWHQLLNGIAAKDFNGLLARVQNETDMRVKFNEKFFDSLGITFRKTMMDPVEIEMQDPKSFWLKRIPTQILAHELLHGLHSRHNLLDACCKEKQYQQLDFMGSISFESAHKALYGQALMPQPDYFEVQRTLGSLMIPELKLLRQSMFSEYLCRYLTAKKFGPYLHGNLTKAAYLMPFGLGPKIPKQNQLDVSNHFQNILKYIDKAIARESDPATAKKERKISSSWAYSGLC